MTEILWMSIGLLYACLAVHCYRLGLRDGMRREKGLEPIVKRSAGQRAPESKEDKAARELNSRVDNFRG